MLNKLSILPLIILLLACSDKPSHVADINIIPKPSELSAADSNPFSLKNISNISISDSSAMIAGEHARRLLGTDLEITIEQDGIFFLELVEGDIPTEGYKLKIDENTVHIQATDVAGLFYGVETVRQLLPPDYSSSERDDTGLPAVQINDQPRFPWRGMHLDVSRHFMPVEFVKEFIDYLAFHKLNVFHWHLVDGIGWRIEIKSHPELTEQGAWRIVKEDKMPWQEYETWKPGDDRPKYGGFYTQEEIKEVVAYASERQITIVPEIELPGHSRVVFDIYPELICVDYEGNPLNNAGVYCAANEGSYQLLEDVLDEVMELFPSEFIHIGGDEVGKGNWKNCARCSHLMHANAFDAEELQSYFVNHFDEYLRDAGRKLIGWHEITEGDLSESAAIMYWGGHNGTADYMRRGHKTVLSPGSHLYFDHYQSLSEYEPKAWGGFSDLQEVYEYEPVPSNLEEKWTDNILGIQANVWTEYIPTPEHVEYMVFPRMAALSEVAWSDPQKNWEEFRVRVKTQLKRYKAMGANYAKSGFRPQIEMALNKDKSVTVSLNTEIPADIYYTKDGSEPNPENGKKFIDSFRINEGVVVRAISIQDGKILTEPEQAEVVMHTARGAEVKLESEGYGNYKAKGGKTLVDVEFGGDKWGNGKWLGVLDNNLSATVDLGEIKTLSSVALSCIEETGAGIYFPRKFIVSISKDGNTFVEFGNVSNIRDLPIPRTSDIKNKSFKVTGEKSTARYIRVIAEYQPVEGQGVFVFADELIVY